MEKTRTILACTILILASMASINALPAKATKGPRNEDLVVRFYPDIGAAYTALKFGFVDLISNAGYAGSLSTSGKRDGDGFLTPAQVADAQADPNLILWQTAALNTYQFDLNNNYTIPDAPSYTSPMSYVAMRRAVAWCTNKTFIVSAIWGGLAERIDQMIPAPLKGHANESYWYPNYPYEYDPVFAAAVLDTTFPKGMTTNLYYDPAFPGSSDKIRTYPTGHELEGQDLNPLVFCVRSDDPRRGQAGQLIVDNMRKMGVPIDPVVGDKDALNDRVMVTMNYHLYTGSWDYIRFPATALYGFYHSDFYYANGRNYITGISQGVPKYPLLDQYLEAANYALTFDEAVHATKNAGGYMTVECLNVPLVSDLGYCCWSKNLLAVVNMEGYGATNPYMFMNAYKADRSAIRVGQISPPNAANIVYSSWWHDYNVLDRMTLYGGIDVPPYRLAEDQTGFVKAYAVGTWDDHEETHTLVSMTLRSDSYFCEPVTGNQKANVDADEYFFNAWYDFQVGNGWFSPSFADLDHVVKTGTYSFDIYFNTLSYFNFYYCQGPLRPMDVWGSQPDLVTVSTESFVNPITPGYIPLAHDPVWIVSATFNGVPLIPFVDYNIDADTLGDPSRLHIYPSLGAGTLVVTYWSVNDPRGYTPGNLPWQTIFEGSGMYYCTDFDPTQYAVFKKNPFYYMQTPILGEIDFVRKLNGAYKIDIFDLVIAAGAYGDYFPGADLAPRGGIIDIFDIVTLASAYGKEWDPPV